MGYIERYVLASHSKLNQFRASEKYVDVTIKCGNRSFKCHRLALAMGCDFFDVMFGSNFKESTEEVIDLCDAVSASTFEEVLQFIYTGDVIITFDNVYDLLQASEYFKLNSMADSCVRFIKSNKPWPSSENMFDIFLFACSTNKTKLIEMLKCYMTKQLQVYFRSTEFLDIEFDLLIIILRQWVSTSKDEVINAIVRWISHSRDKRLQYFDRFAEELHFENVSSAYMKFIVKKFIANSDPASLMQVSESPDYVDSDADLSKSETSLYVYVKYSNENTMKVLSITQPHSCSIVCDTPTEDKITYLRSVRVDDTSLYCLNFYVISDYDDLESKFVRCSSVNMYSELILRPPPVLLSQFQLCNLRNRGIYLYDEAGSASRLETTTPYPTVFNEDEIYRGIYHYNCERDSWFPVPEMKKRTDESCIAVLDDLLYLIGGQGAGSDFPSGFTQVYDHRAGEWQELPRANREFIGAGCCVMDGKIYVCGGSHKTYASVYDPVAGKWDAISSMTIPMQNLRVVPYADRLWAFQNCDEVDENDFTNFSIDVYDLKRNEWNVSTVLRDATHHKSSLSRYFKEAVVFKAM